MNKHLKADLMLLIASIIWGTTFIANSSILGSNSSSFILFARFTGSALILLPFYLKYKTPNLVRNNITISFFLGICLFLAYTFHTLSLKYTSDTNASFLMYTFAIFIPIFQLLFFRKLPLLGNILGIVLVMFGSVFMTTPDNMSIKDYLLNLGLHFNFGDLLSVFSAIFMAIHIIGIDYARKKDHDALTLTILQFAFIAVFSFISIFAYDFFNLEANIITLNINTLAAISYLAIFATALTLVLQIRFQKDSSPAKVAIIFAFEPITALFLESIFKGKELNSHIIIGGLLIVSGVIISEIWEHMPFVNKNTKEY